MGENLNILTIGDLHVYTKTLPDIAILRQKINNYLSHNKPDAIVLLGDMANDHSKVHLLAYNTICDFLKELCSHCPVYYTVGNHDCLNNSVFQTEDHFFYAFKNGWNKNLHIIDHAQVVEIKDGYRYLMIPYVSPGRFEEAVSSCGLESLEGIKAIFCHQEFKGCKMGAVESTIGDDWQSDVLTISGHIHDRQLLRGGKIVYVGTPYCISFGDTGKKTISLFEFDQKGHKEHLVDLEMPKKVTKKINAKDFNALEIEDHSRYRIVVEDSWANIEGVKKSNKYKKLKDNVKILLKPLDIAPISDSISKSQDYDTIVQELLSSENQIVKQIYEEACRDANQA